jgi:hypothetical protein
MRVDGFPDKTTIADLVSPNATRAVAGDSTSSAAPGTTETFRPTADLQSLLAALQQAPVIRQEVVTDVAERLRAGELNTPKAKAETVSAILGTTLPGA